MSTTHEQPATAPATPAGHVPAETVDPMWVDLHSKAEDVRRAENVLREAVRAERERGRNASSIARALGVTRQAVQQRFPKASA